MQDTHYIQFYGFLFLILLLMASYNGLDPRETNSLVSKFQSSGLHSVRRQMLTSFQELLRFKGLKIIDLATMIALQSYHVQEKGYNQSSIPFSLPTLGIDSPRLRVGGLLYYVNILKG